MLNVAQKHQDPDAYEPEFVVMHRKKQEELKIAKRDPLFDFDEDFDELSEVSDRYP